MSSFCVSFIPFQLGNEVVVRVSALMGVEEDANDCENVLIVRILVDMNNVQLSIEMLSINSVL